MQLVHITATPSDMVSVQSQYQPSLLPTNTFLLRALPMEQKSEVSWGAANDSTCSPSRRPQAIPAAPSTTRPAGSDPDAVSRSSTCAAVTLYHPHDRDRQRVVRGNHSQPNDQPREQPLEQIPVSEAPCFAIVQIALQSAFVLGTIHKGLRKRTRTASTTRSTISLSPALVPRRDAIRVEFPGPWRRSR